jgi:hypothetical protein
MDENPDDAQLYGHSEPPAFLFGGSPYDRRAANTLVASALAGTISISIR